MDTNPIDRQPLCNAFVRVMALTLVALASASEAACQSGYTRLVVFGDSLSDYRDSVPNSGTPTGLVQFDARASNGFLWCELVSQRLGVPIDNPAVSGSSAIDVIESQVPLYLGGGSPDPDALFAIMTSGNDLLRAVGPSAEASTQERESFAGAIADNIERSVRALAAAGARSFLVSNALDVARTPEILSEAAPQRAAVRDVAQRINARLATALPALAAELGVEIVAYDFFGFLDDVATDPASFGLQNVTGPLMIEETEMIVGDPAVYFWWDGVHPSGTGHRLLADDIMQTLGAAGCSAADLAAPFGVLSQTDVDAFVSAFFAADPGVASLAPPASVVSQADVDAFV
ncbi:MAG: SGNH/GDSL hydrolase family protein, partial [Planctomycetota bacterium]